MTFIGTTVPRTAWPAIAAAIAIDWAISFEYKWPTSISIAASWISASSSASATPALRAVASTTAKNGLPGAKNRGELGARDKNGEADKIEYAHRLDDHRR